MYDDADFAILVILSPGYTATTARVWSHGVLSYVARLIPSLRPGTTIVIHDDSMYWEYEVKP